MIKFFSKLFLYYNLLPLNVKSSLFYNKKKYIKIFKKNFFNFRYFSNLSFKENLNIYINQILLGNTVFYQTLYLLNNFFENFFLNRNHNLKKEIKFF